MSYLLGIGCAPYGAKIIGISHYPPLAQWATVVTLRWGCLYQISCPVRGNTIVAHCASGGKHCSTVYSSRRGGTMLKTFKRPTVIIRKVGAANRSPCFPLFPISSLGMCLYQKLMLLFSTHSYSLHGNESKLCRPYGAKKLETLLTTACAVGYGCYTPMGCLYQISCPVRGNTIVAHCASGGKMATQ